MSTSIIGELYGIRQRFRRGRQCTGAGWPASVQYRIYFYRARIPQLAGIRWRSSTVCTRRRVFIWIFHHFLTLSKVRRRMVFARTYLLLGGGGCGVDTRVSGGTMRQTHSMTVCHSRARTYVVAYIFWPVGNQVEFVSRAGKSSQQCPSAPWAAARLVERRCHVVDRIIDRTLIRPQPQFSCTASRERFRCFSNPIGFQIWRYVILQRLWRMTYPFIMMVKDIKCWL